MADQRFALLQGQAEEAEEAEKDASRRLPGKNGSRSPCQTGLATTCQVGSLLIAMA